MPVSTGIDFQRIRAHHGDQKLGFEELMRQLLVASPPKDCIRLEHKGAGADGGVETLAHLHGGVQWGYQSKYFPLTFEAGQISQIRASFQSALATYPDMIGWTVAIPRNLSDAGKAGLSTQRSKWDAFVAGAKAEAKAVHREIEIELWDETGLIHSLSTPGAIFDGMRAYWFDEAVLTKTWFKDRFEVVRADLGDRYHSDEHVDVTAQRSLDTLGREPGYLALFTQHLATFGRVRSALGRLEPFVERSDGADHELADLRRKLDACELVAFALPYASPSSFDLGPHITGLETLRALPAFKRLKDSGYPLEDETGDGREGRLRAGYAFRETLEDFDQARRALPRQVLMEHRLLLVGEAGAGKSHSLAHLVERHIQQGFPAVMLLGQMFASGDPRGLILSHLSLRLDFGTFLGALQAAAGATGRPALIVIDALNESRDKTLWSSALAGLAAEIGQYNQLALIVSCRDVYERSCIPRGLKIPRHVHKGFEGDGAAAAKAYLDRNGIDRPGTPFLDTEFTNPLFLTTCVRRLRAEGKSAFPMGLEGITRLFEFWLEGVEHSLLSRGYTRISAGDGRIRRALNKFADQLALERVDALPFSQARALFEEEVAGFSSSGPDDDLVQRLIAEGVLRHVPSDAGGDEEVSFTFQRFSDYFTADALLRLFDTPSNLAKALKPGGDLEHLLPGWEYDGIVEALWVQAPEQLGIELADLEPGFSKAVKLELRGFLESLRWRAPTAVTARTVELFERVWDRPEVRRSPLLELLLQVSSQAGHALNADYLHERMTAMPLPDRDALLTVNLEMHDDGGPVDTLIAWASEARLELADREHLRLAATALSWFLSSPKRFLRDRASRALARIFRAWPDLAPVLIASFADVDDPYVRERVLAAAHAALLFVDRDNAALPAAALAAWHAVFARSPVERHAFIRHYARGIVELAAAHDRLPTEIALSFVRPPYASAPISHWPSIEDVARLKDEASEIVSSVVGYYREDEKQFSMPGDFGNYTMGQLGSEFTASLQRDGTPQTMGECRKTFWDGLLARAEPSRSLAQAALDSRRAYDDAHHARGFRYFDLERDSSGDEEADVEVLEAVFSEADTALKAVLTEADMPQGYLSYPGHTDSNYVPFGKGKARRWVAARAVELGWSKEKHAEIEQEHLGGSGRSEHAVERIGKKYQWIAYHELIGHLADYHWFLRWREEPVILDDVLLVEDLDIDLSFAGLDRSLLPIGLPSLGLRPTNFEPLPSVEASIAWAQSLDDLPEIQSVVEGLDEAGTRWWVVSSWRQDDHYMSKQQADGPMRSSQAQIQLIVMRPADLEMLYAQAVTGRTDLNELSEDEHARARLFGEYRPETALADRLLNQRFMDFEVGRLSHAFSPDRGEYDLGGVKGGSFAVPRGPVLTGLGLGPAGPSQPWFVNALGELVLIDQGVSSKEHLPDLVNADRLEPWLAAQGLVVAWRYWGEKDGGMGSGAGFSRRDGPFARETFCGLWWKDGAAWNGSNWHATGTKPGLSEPL